VRQPTQAASGTRISGAAVEPSRLEPSAWPAPMAMPRRSGLTSATIIAWLTGITPPSAMPISSRAPSSARKLPARPEMNEQAQNMIVAISRIGLRMPSRSEIGPTVRPASAHVSETPEAIMPTCVLLSPRSGWIAGIMKFLKMNDRARAEEGYDYYVGLMPVMPMATANGVKSVLQFLAAAQPKAATAHPEEFYDMSFLKKIEASGFTKSLASRR